MSLRHPENKMSKSSDDINGTIYFNDEKDNILKNLNLQLLILKTLLGTILKINQV